MKRDSLTLVVISDTHSKPHPRALELARAQEPDGVLHAGDIGDLSCVAPFRELAPLTLVRGNIDGRGPELPDDVLIAIEHEERSVLDVLLTHVAVAGPRIRKDAAERATGKGAGLIVCGHSHVPFVGQDRGLIVFNAGSIGPRRFQLPIVFGVLRLRLEDGAPKLAMHHIDCETGERWMP